jgi:hypothetical protein
MVVKDETPLTPSSSLTIVILSLTPLAVAVTSTEVLAPNCAEVKLNVAPVAEATLGIVDQVIAEVKF